MIIAADNGAILYYSRQYDRAIAQFLSAMEMDPNFSRSSMVIDAYAAKGMFAEARVRAQALIPKIPDSPWNWSWLAYIYGRSGRQEQARRAIDKLKQLDRIHRVDPRAFVTANLGLGNYGEALAWFEKAYSDYPNALTSIKVDPILDPLRGDPHFQNLMHCVGL
jgi:tetratricopeptide (TPR) repeat protein